VASKKGAGKKAVAKSIPRRSAKAMAKPSDTKKQMPLTYPKPDDMPGKVKLEPPKIPQPSESIDLSPSPRMKEAEKKKTLPYKATAVLGALAVSIALALFFIFVINLDALFALCLTLPFFIGLSILFYEFLELSDKTAQ
jgi:hypothetical protein